MNTGTMKNEYGTVGVGNMDNAIDMTNSDILSVDKESGSFNAVASVTTDDLRKSANLRKTRGFGVSGKMTFVAIISCTRDYVALAKSLDMVVGDNVKRVFLFGGNAPKRYEIPPQILELQELLTESGDGAFFYNANAPETLVKVDAYLRGIGADVWFFLNAGDTVQELYPAYLESFFSYNKGKCGVVFTPVLTDGITANLVKDDPRLPVEFQYLPKGGLFSYAEDFERFPKQGDGRSLLDGAAVLAEDAVAAGLDFEKGSDAFADLVEQAAQVNGAFGKLKMVYIARGLDRTLKAINEVKTLVVVHKPKIRRDYLVSCIIPVYNVALYLEEAIESIITQTIGFEENIQLILVNDGGTDACGEICEKYAKKYPYNVFCIMQNNKGVSAARNSGLDIASGEWVCFLDGSDRLAFDFCEKSIELCTARKSRVIACPVRIVFWVYKRDQLLNYSFRKSSSFSLNSPSHYTFPIIGSMLFKREVVDDIRFVDSDWFYSERFFIHAAIIRSGGYAVTTDTSYFRRYPDNPYPTLRELPYRANWLDVLLKYLDSYIAESEKVCGYVTNFTKYVIADTMAIYQHIDVKRECADKHVTTEEKRRLLDVVKLIRDDIFSYNPLANKFMTTTLYYIRNIDVNMSATLDTPSRDG